MGRHSAPDDDDDSAVDVLRVEDVRAAVAASPRPRPVRESAAPEVVPAVDPDADTAGLTAVPAQADGGDRIGQAKPRPGGVVRSAMARTGRPPAEPDLPRADDDTSPGLALIERAMSGAPPRPADGDLPEATDETVQIPIIADPVLDEPVPEAVTEQIRPVTDGPAPVPAPTGTPVDAPADAPTDAPADAPAEGTTDVPADETAAQPDPADTAAAKADKDAAKADKAAVKADKAAAKAAAKADKDAARAAAKEHEGRISDVALLRSDASVRARVAAAVVVPFVLYVAVLLILDSFEVRTALIWIWIPLVTAGVVGGLILDLAHRAAAAAASSGDDDDRQRTDSPEPAAP